MSEKLIDVVNSSGAVIHTYPITLPDAELPSQTNFEAKALEATRFSRLVPNSEVASLTTRSHLMREGALEPYDTPRKDPQSKASLEEDVRLKAYFFWEHSENQNGLADDNWHKAVQQHRRERAYVLWKSEGCKEDRANEYWHRAVQFEAA